MQRLRLDGPEVDEVVAEVRRRVRRHGAPTVGWWVSDRSTPADLEARLLALGLRIRADDYEIAGLGLDREPPPAPAGIEVVRADTPTLYREAVELQWDAFGTSATGRERERATLDERLDDVAAGITTMFVARLDGRTAGAARSVYSPRGVLLVGGATAEWARGLGAYLALVRARWDDAVARGTPFLAVQAGARSAPILRRLGFEDVCRFRRLEDVLEPT